MDPSWVMIHAPTKSPSFTVIKLGDLSREVFLILKGTKKELLGNSSTSSSDDKILLDEAPVIDSFKWKFLMNFLGYQFASPIFSFHVGNLSN